MTKISLILICLCASLFAAQDDVNIRRPIGAAATKLPGDVWVAIRGVSLSRGECLWLMIGADLGNIAGISWSNQAVTKFGHVWFLIPEVGGVGDLVVATTRPDFPIALVATAWPRRPGSHGGGSSGSNPASIPVFLGYPGNSGDVVVQVGMLATRGPATDARITDIRVVSFDQGQRVGTWGTRSVSALGRRGARQKKIGQLWSSTEESGRMDSRSS